MITDVMALSVAKSSATTIIQNTCFSQRMLSTTCTTWYHCWKIKENANICYVPQNKFSLQGLSLCNQWPSQHQYTVLLVYRWIHIILRPSYLYDGNHISGKTIFILKRGPTAHRSHSVSQQSLGDRYSCNKSVPILYTSRHWDKGHSRTHPPLKFNTTGTIQSLDIPR